MTAESVKFTQHCNHGTMFSLLGKSKIGFTEEVYLVPFSINASSIGRSARLVLASTAEMFRIFSDNLAISSASRSGVEYTLISGSVPSSFGVLSGQEVRHGLGQSSL